MIKKLKNKLGILLVVAGLLISAGTAYAFNIPVPQPTAKGQIPIGLTTGNYQAGSLLGGTNITIDTSVAGQITVNSTASGGGGATTTIAGLTPANGTFVLSSANTALTVATSAPGTITLTINLPITAAQGGTGTTTVPTQLGQLLAVDGSNSKYAPTTLVNTATLTVSTGTPQQLSFNVVKVPNALTFNNSGSGAASGQTFDGSGAATISYNTIGAQVSGTYLGNTNVSGASPQVAYFTGANTVNGSNNFTWLNTAQMLGINSSTPQATLVVQASSSSQTLPIFAIANNSSQQLWNFATNGNATNNGYLTATGTPVIALYHNATTTAAFADTIGGTTRNFYGLASGTLSTIQFWGQNSSSTLLQYASINGLNARDQNSSFGCGVGDDNGGIDFNLWSSFGPALYNAMSLRQDGCNAVVSLRLGVDSSYGNETAQILANGELDLFAGGDGHNAILEGSDGFTNGSNGGNGRLLAGNGSTNGTTTGGSILITSGGGHGGIGSNAGDILIQGGRGGQNGSAGGRGGNLTLQAGAATGLATKGNILLSVGAGNNAATLNLDNINVSNSGSSQTFTFPNQTGTFILQNTTGGFGVGSSTPGATFAVEGTSTSPTLPIFSVASSSNVTVFSIDAKGHEHFGGTAPTVSSCGTTPNGSVSGNDVIGDISTGGTSPTACTLTFARPYTSVICVVTDDLQTSEVSVTATSTTAITMTMSAALTSHHIYYHCADKQ